MTDMNEELKRQLDKKAQSLSPEINQKLAQARAKAVLQARTNKGAANDGQWIKPMLTLAACVCLVVPLWLSGVLNTHTTSAQFDLANQLQPSSLSITELEQNSALLELATLNDDELELVENLDFALWLLQQEQVSS